VTTTQNMFAQAEVFQGSLANWQLTKCSNLSGMFSGQNIAGQGYNQPIATWTLGKVTNATSMFENNQMFNQPLDGWGNWMDPAGSCTVNAMFKNAPAFNQSLNGWTTTRMTSCEDMFHSALAFNGNISSWDVSNVTNMRGMFLNTNAFNNNISSWNVSNVTTMLTMFESARAFNQPISSWNTANVTNMSQMFSGATAFNQDLSAWNLYRAPTTGVGPSMSGFWHTSYSYGGAVGISQENYDRTIIGWANKAKAAQIALPGFTGKVVGVPRQVSFGRPTAITGGSTTYGSGVYTTGAAAQTYLSGNPVFVAEGAQWTFTAG
jgi:surface protein